MPINNEAKRKADPALATLIPPKGTTVKFGSREGIVVGTADLSYRMPNDGSIYYIVALEEKSQAFLEQNDDDPKSYHDCFIRFIVVHASNLQYLIDRP